MFAIGQTIVTDSGKSGWITGIGVSVRNGDTIVVDFNGKLTRFSGSELYRVSVSE